MSSYTYGAITNVGICAAVTTAIYLTGSAWPLLGLFLIQIPRQKGE